MMAEQQTALLSKQFDAGELFGGKGVGGQGSWHPTRTRQVPAAGGKPCQENEAPRRDPADGQTRTPGAELACHGG